MKTVALIIVFLGLSFAGYYKSLTLYRRTNELDLFIAIIEHIRDEIRYLRLPAPRIIKKLCSLKRFSEYEVLKIFESELKNKRSIIEGWEITVERAEQISELNHDDLIILNSFFEGLGSTDEQGQGNLCSSALSELKRQRKDADEYCKKHARLYRSLGILAGLFVCVILM